MITAAAIFNKFKGSGMLHAVAWAPAGGGPGATFEARLMRAGMSDLPYISGSVLAIQFDRADAAVAQDDSAIVDPGTATEKTYTLRERDEANCSADGTLVSYTLREVVTP